MGDLTRRKFLLGLAGAAAGILFPDILLPKKAEAGIIIYRGNQAVEQDSLGDYVYPASDRPSHRYNSDENYIPNGDYYNYDYDNVDLGISVKETYLNFGALENRLYTDQIVIHHIGNTNADVSAAEVHQWHLNRGWSGIGYHFLIRKDGTVERGRPLDTMGAHAEGENNHTVGINIVGNFEVALPTDEQIYSAASLTAALCRLYRIYPSANTIVGHRDLNRTACPGKYMYDRMDVLRRMVKKAME